MKLWDIKASLYHYFRRLLLFRRILEREIKALQSLVHLIPKRYPCVIDLGTGAGSTLGIYSDDVLIIGMDRSLNMVQRASKYRDNFISVVGSADHLPFRKSCAPIISAIGLSEYIRDKKHLIHEIQSVLRKNGYILITISPPSFLNRMRNLLGNRIYPIAPKQWKTMFMKAGWICRGERSTLLQRQYLLK